jgi:hypothetical protein
MRVSTVSGVRISGGIRLLNPGVGGSAAAAKLIKYNNPTNLINSFIKCLLIDQ